MSDQQKLGIFFTNGNYIQPTQRQKQRAFISAINQRIETLMTTLKTLDLLTKNTQVISVQYQTARSPTKSTWKIPEAKINTRNNILHQGPHQDQMQQRVCSSALGLVNSLTCRISFMIKQQLHKVYTQPNNTMRVISGTINNTPTRWLPILSHITNS